MYISCKLCKDDYPAINMDNLEFICDHCMDQMFQEFGVDFDEDYIETE